MRFLSTTLCTFLVLVSTFSTSWAGELVLKEISGNVYAIVGDLTNRTKDNLGNNATFGFVVTTEGVVLIDSGGTYNGAKECNYKIYTGNDGYIPQFNRIGLCSL